MRLIRDYTFKWWQVSIIKVCLLALGIAIGATWTYIFMSWTTILWIIFAVTALYLIYDWFKQP